jgi:transposase-like protein
MVSPLTVGSKIKENPTTGKESIDMEKRQIASIGDFCTNEACEEYKKIDRGNIIKYGTSGNGKQRYRCKTCKKVFTETKGTIFYRTRHTQEEIVECMQLLADRNSLAAIHRIKGIKEETVLNWLERAEDHVDQFEQYLIKEYKLTRVQIDALWTFVGHKGEKGGTKKRMHMEPFGVERASTSIPV